MPKTVNVAGIEGVNGRGTDYFESSSLENQNNNDSYSEYGGLFCGGLEVTEDIKNQLESQPNSKFLYFEKTDDGKYLINPKLPEEGAVNTVEYNYELDDDGNIKSFGMSERKNINFSIRKNVNYLYKAIANSFIDENDNIDVEKGFKTFHELGDSVCFDYYSPDDMANTKSISAKKEVINYNEGLKKIANFVIKNTDMPEEDKQDFINFCKAGVFRSGLSLNTEQPEMINGRFWDDCDSMLLNTVIAAVNMKNDKQFNGKEFDEIKESQLKSLEKFENDIRYLSKIDPKNEKKFINIFQAESVPVFFSISNDLSNNISKEKTPKLVPIQLDQKNISKKTAEAGKTVDRGFNTHKIVPLEFKINGKDCLLTIDANSRGEYETFKDFSANNQTFIGLHQVGQGEPRKFDPKDFANEIKFMENDIRNEMRKTAKLDPKELDKYVAEEFEALRKSEEKKFIEAKARENIIAAEEERLYKKAKENFIKTQRAALNEYQKLVPEKDKIEFVFNEGEYQNELNAMREEAKNSAKENSKVVDLQLNSEIAYINVKRKEAKERLKDFLYFFEDKLVNEEKGKLIDEQKKIYAEYQKFVPKEDKKTFIFNEEDYEKELKEIRSNVRKNFEAVLNGEKTFEDIGLKVNKDNLDFSLEYALPFKLDEKTISANKAKINKNAEAKLRANLVLDENEVKKQLDEEVEAFKAQKEAKFKENKRLENLKNFFKESPDKVISTASFDASNKMNKVINELIKPKDDLSYNLSIKEIKNNALMKKSGLDVLDSFLGCKDRDIYEYAKDLGKLHINGAKATTVFDLEDLSNISKDEVEARVYVAAARLKEMFDNNLDYSQPVKMHFAVENKDGRLEPIYAANEMQEVKEVEKPGKAYKLFHSKEKYEAKMKEWENYQDYKKYTENLKRINEETKDFYNELNEMRQQEKSNEVEASNNVKKEAEISTSNFEEHTVNVKNILNMSQDHNIVEAVKDKSLDSKEPVKRVTLNDLTEKNKGSNSAEKLTQPISKDKTNQLDKQIESNQKKNH